MRKRIIITIETVVNQKNKEKFCKKPLSFNKHLCYTLGAKRKRVQVKGGDVMANIFDFANFFIDLSIHNDEDPMTNLRLNKLLYFAQGCSLARRGKPLFSDKIEAWQYGPVVPSVYHNFKSYKKNPIDKVFKKYDPSVFSPEEFDLLIDVAREFGKYTSPTLVNISHAQDGPWRRVFDSDTEKEIPLDEMEKYFKFHSLDPCKKTVLENSESIYGKRDKDGFLVLPKELDDGWSL